MLYQCDLWHMQNKANMLSVLALKLLLKRLLKIGYRSYV